MKLASTSSRVHWKALILTPPLTISLCCRAENSKHILLVPGASSYHLLMVLSFIFISLFAEIMTRAVDDYIVISYSITVLGTTSPK
jgi:hypothetical protein